MNGNSERKPIWLDCDPGVDDMIAIMLAVQNPKINLLGISTIGGNISTEKVVKNALNIINISGFPEIPILKGCSDPICRETGISSTHGQSGLGPDFAFPLHHLKVKEKNLFAYLSEVIMNFPVKITLISTGPLTNFALLLKTYPEVKTNIDSIVFMGGSVESGNYTPSCEFNIGWDPEAAKIIFSSGLKVVMIPLGVTLKTLTNETVMNYLKDMNSNFGNYVLNVLMFRNEMYQKHYDIKYGVLHDPCAVAYVINKEIFKTQEMNVEIETKSEFCDGRTVCDVYDKMRKTKNALVGLDIDLDKFWDLIFDAWNKCNKISILNK